jgi:deoxyribodipyrimidine photo-lyase
MNQKRVVKLNTKDILRGPILYWMNREMRVQDNWSLLYAQELANNHKQPLVVVYNLVPNFLGGGKRQLAFKIEALKEIQKNLKKKNISFHVIVDATGKNSGKEVINFSNQIKAGAIVTDFYPLKLPRSWNDYVRKNVSCAFFGVEAHNIVPTWIASDKKEYGAYTIRPKIHRLLPEFFDEFPILKKHQYTFNTKIPEIRWDTIMSETEITESLKSISWAPAGESGAKKILQQFIKKGIHTYADQRNDPNKDAQSNLSPYLHYGMIAPQRVALEIVKITGKNITDIVHHAKNKAKIEIKNNLNITDHAGAFLEEIIIRRELSDNFCFYDANYDNPDCFPDWAKKSLTKSEKEPRTYLYTKKQFETGETHDNLWNAAQMQMVMTGKMHGYMRMYWAKKILEWTKDSSDAMKIAIYLNDTYSLDGRDPNGYAGIAWSIGGVHDRAWFSRPVFGQIRYMSYGGCKGKFDVKKYIETWLKKR